MQPRDGVVLTGDRVQPGPSLPATQRSETPPTSSDAGPCVPLVSHAPPDGGPDPANGTGFPWGPWLVDDDDIAPVRLNITVGIRRRAWGPSPDMTERFARYERVKQLAGASPDLLAACEAVYANLHPTTAEAHSPELAAALADVVKAIAKARGGAR